MVKHKINYCKVLLQGKMALQVVCYLYSLFPGVTIKIYCLHSKITHHHLKWAVELLKIQLVKETKIMYILF